jgi:hypothetical protein
MGDDSEIKIILAEDPGVISEVDSTNQAPEVPVISTGLLPSLDSSILLQMPTDSSSIEVLEAHAPTPSSSHLEETLDLNALIQAGSQSSISIEEPAMALPLDDEPVEPSLTLAGEAPLGVADEGAPAEVNAGVKKATRRYKIHTRTQPKEWSPATVGMESHPYAKGVERAVKGGASGGIVFTFDPTVQTYFGTHTLGSGYRSKLWIDLRWNSAWLPDLWKNMLRMGALEVGPPAFGKINNSSGSRNVLRFALGAELKEWMSVFTLGNDKKPDAVIVIFSESSIQSQFEAIKLAFKNRVNPATGKAA